MLNSTLAISMSSTVTARSEAEAVMAAAGYGLKDVGRRPEVEHYRCSDPLARLVARGAYLPGC